MPIALSAIRDELFPGLRGVEGKYEEIPSQYDKVFEIGKSEMNIERTTEMAYLPLATVKQEGAATTFDNAAGQRFTWNLQHTAFGLGYSITREAIDDNLYKAQFDPSNLGLAFSFHQTKEIVCANILNNATTYNAAFGGDGVALCATNHPVDGSTWSNRPSPDTDLNEAALESALTSIRYFPDQRNLRIFCRGRKLLVPPQLKYVALRLLYTELRPGTANNDVNAMLQAGDLGEKFMVMDFLTSSFAWFILTDKKGLYYLQRKAFETDMTIDFLTDSLLVKAYERYGVGYFNPRSIFGSFPTA